MTNDLSKGAMCRRVANQNLEFRNTRNSQARRFSSFGEPSAGEYPKGTALSAFRSLAIHLPGQSNRAVISSNKEIQMQPATKHGTQLMPVTGISSRFMVKCDNGTAELFKKRKEAMSAVRFEADGAVAEQPRDFQEGPLAPS